MKPLEPGDSIKFASPAASDMLPTPYLCRVSPDVAGDGLKGVGLIVVPGDEFDMPPPIAPERSPITAGCSVPCHDISW